MYFVRLCLAGRGTASLSGYNEFVPFLVFVRFALEFFLRQIRGFFRPLVEVREEGDRL